MATHTHGKMRILSPVALAANSESFVRIGNTIKVVKSTPQDKVSTFLSFLICTKLKSSRQFAFVFCSTMLHCSIESVVPVWQPEQLPYREHIVGSPDESVSRLHIYKAMLGMQKTGCSGDTRLVLHTPSPHTCWKAYLLLLLLIIMQGSPRSTL